MWFCKLSMVCTFVGLLIPTNCLSYLLLGILWFSFPLTPYNCSILHFTGNSHGCKLKEESESSACLWALHQLQRQRGEGRGVHEEQEVKYSLGSWMLQYWVGVGDKQLEWSLDVVWAWNHSSIRVSCHAHLSSALGQADVLGHAGTQMCVSVCPHTLCSRDWQHTSVSSNSEAPSCSAGEDLHWEGSHWSS